MQHSGRNQAISEVKDAMKELKINKELKKKENSEKLIKK